MFKLKPESQFTHTVKILVPVDGGHVGQDFKATFRMVGIDEISNVDTLDGEQSLLKKIIVGLDDILGDDGEPVPYSDGLRDQLLALPYVHRPILQTYLAAVTKVSAAS